MKNRIQISWQLFGMATRADRTVTVIVLVLSVIQAGAVAGIGQSQRLLVDSTGSSHVSGVAAAVVLGTLAHAAMASLPRIQVNLTNDLSDRVALILSQDILTLTANVSGIEHLERPDYLDRLTLLRKGARGLAAFSWAIVQTAASTVSLGLSVWLLWGVEPMLALLSLFTVPWLWLGHRAQNFLHTAQQASAEAVRLELHLHELCLTPGPAKELYISGSGPELSRQAAELWDQTTRLEDQARLRGTALQSLGWLCFALGLATSLAVSADLVISNRASTGDIVLVVSLALQLRMQINATVQGLEQVSIAARMADHYQWLQKYSQVQRTEGNDTAPERLSDGITLDNVSFRYPGTEMEVLHNIDLHFPAGSTIGLVGVNGAGKSTLVKLLTGMYRPSSGAISVDGQPFDMIAPRSWASRSTGAFQDFVKFEFPLRESVGVGDLARVDDSAAVLEAMNRAGAADLIPRLPEGLATKLGKTFDGTELSHGQWQRLAVARAFMRRAPVLIVLDEPSAALDPQAEHELFNNFAAQVARASRDGGAVTLLVSHRFSTVRMANHIVVLSDGTVIEQGTHDSLMAKGGHYAGLYKAQARGYS